MINVIKEAENGKADLDAYTKKVIFELFPVIETSVFYAGVALSDGWSQVGLFWDYIFWLYRLYGLFLIGCSDEICKSWKPLPDG